ncbi:hypothetical protein TNCV_4478301 [Trichonephila clavipes]|nr:hypothetical protein TNCV_4478301 [Trichonephila clavipes]
MGKWVRSNHEMLSVRNQHATVHLVCVYVLSLPYKFEVIRSNRSLDMMEETGSLTTLELDLATQQRLPRVRDYDHSANVATTQIEICNNSCNSAWWGEETRFQFSSRRYNAADLQLSSFEFKCLRAMNINNVTA